MSSSHPSSATARAYAKVNVRLSVGPPRADGYHDLVNVFHAVSLFDEVTARPGERLSVAVRGRAADQVPDGEDNLAARAALLLAERTGVSPEVELVIHKAIPVAGGMAGGSADAAAALVACDALWGTGLGREGLAALGAELGSDVPFALLGGTAVGYGRGEVLAPVRARGPFHWVFALAEGGLSTPAVYAECDRLRGVRGAPEPAPDDVLMVALAAGDAATVGAHLANDLQDAAVSLRADLAATLAVGRQRDGVLGALVSGSGPTCAFLVRSGGHADQVAEALRTSGTCADTVRADGPAPGTHLI